MLHIYVWPLHWTRDGDAGPAVPEPGTMTLVMLGLGSLGYLRRRKASTK